MDFQSTTDEKVLVRLEPKTAAGSPAKVDGKPEWSVEAEGGGTTDVTVEPSKDGLSAYYISGTTPGNYVWRVKADADMGEGVRHIEEFGTYTVVDAQAEALNATAGTPEPKDGETEEPTELTEPTL